MRHRVCISLIVMSLIAWGVWPLVGSQRIYVKGMNEEVRGFSPTTGVVLREEARCGEHRKAPWTKCLHAPPAREPVLAVTKSEARRAPGKEALSKSAVHLLWDEPCTPSSPARQPLTAQ